MTTVPAQFNPSQLQKFMNDVNMELFPVLQIRYAPRGDLTRFEIELCETKYAMRGQVVIEPAFTTLIKQKSLEHLNVEVSFNSNHTIFWYFVEDENGV